MKVKNKLTGEINILKVDEDYFNIYKDDGEFVCPVTLKELNEGWEDYYEEPKGYWSYDTFNNDVTFNSIANEDDRKADQEIGNYFETKEEAEKAVEKLKAWKRLKDKGFRFDKWANASAGPYRPIWFYFEKDTALEDIKSDLDLLFWR